MRSLLFVVLAACGGNDGARHIVDGAGSASIDGQVAFAIQDQTVFLSAYFPTGPASAPPSCTITQVGTCAVTACTSSQPGSTTGTYANAGTITAIGGTPPVTLTAAPDASNAYLVGPMTTASTFNPGDVITLAGTGGTIPAFSQTVTLPKVPQIDAPVDGATVARTNDLTVSWSGGNNTDVIELSMFEMSPYAALNCVFTTNTNTGSATVPSSLLQLLAAGTVTASSTGYSQKTAAVGDIDVAFFAAQSNTDGDGAVYDAELVLQ